MGLTIHDLRMEPLRRIADERGEVMHMLRCDAPHFTRFGEVYFSVVNPTKVKAWKRHREMTQHVCVPVGEVRFVLYDDRPESPSCGALDEVVCGGESYDLLIIPPRIWYGFQGIAAHPSLVANCADLPHDPDESERMDIQAFPVRYEWI